MKLGKPISLGVDSPFLFNHLSFQKPGVLFGVLMVFWKERSLEKMEKSPGIFGPGAACARNQTPTARR